MKIKYKIILLFLIFAVIPLVTMLAYYDFTSKETVMEQVTALTEEILNKNATSLDDRIFSMERKLYLSTNNEIVNDTIYDSNQGQTGNISQAEALLKTHFNSVIYNDNKIKSIIVMYENGDVKIYGSGSGERFSGMEDPEPYMTFFIKETDKFKESSLYKTANEDRNEIFWAYGDFGLDNDHNIYMVKSFIHFSLAKKLGTIVFVLDESFISDYITNTKEYTSFCVTNNQKIISDTKSNEDFQQIVDTMNFAGDKRIINFDTLEDFPLSKKTLTNDWGLLYLIDRNALLSDIDQSGKTILIFIAFAAFAIVVMVFINSRMIYSKIDVILRKFKKLETGDFEIAERIQAKDELGILDRHFNNMVEKLKKLIDQNYVYNLEKREAQLNALQYQINPHFLYNTFDIISSMASVHGCEDIRIATKHLTALFRYNTGQISDDFTTLKDEINHIENYVHLQKLHLSNGFEVFYDIKAETEHCQIMKFILQPFIENTIKHGFAPKNRRYIIEINSLIQDNVLYIQILDDGIGIENEKLREINKKLTPSQNKRIDVKDVKSIGIFNVAERIRLKYGDEYGVSIESDVGKGTCITIKLPKDMP